MFFLPYRVLGSCINKSCYFSHTYKILDNLAKLECFVDMSLYFHISPTDLNSVAGYMGLVNLILFTCPLVGCGTILYYETAWCHNPYHS
jgi:hypothetical protein